ncbi:MAG: bifunctional DNA primase/polymerase [Solirubrobacteraceae bacterium]
MTVLLDAALRYADRGWPVFPTHTPVHGRCSCGRPSCDKPGKHPRTRNGLSDATTDGQTITRWFTAWPEANVAVTTGAPAGIVVLDVDGDNGAESLRALERQHGALPRTASIVTPRGGQHYYFAHPGEEVPNSVSKLGADLDIRGDGGYVLVPPSTGPSGRKYEPDDRCAIAPVPDWLQKAVRRPHTNGERTPASEWVAIVRDGLRRGERNHGLARLTGHLLAKDVDARLVRELAQLVNARCKPPLEADEVDRVVESIAGCELRKRRNGTRR